MLRALQAWAPGDQKTVVDVGHPALREDRGGEREGAAGRSRSLDQHMDRTPAVQAVGQS